jgi:hypothetical protein
MDGTCVPPEDDAGADPDDGGTRKDDAAAPDAGSSDGGTEPDDGGTLRPDGGGLPGCTPDHDGVITREEVPLMAGLRTTFKVARDVEVDTTGTVREDGTRRWDLTGPYPGDHSVLVEARHVDDTWYAEEFPNASYSSRLSEREDLLGVFQLTGERLKLLGVVSPEDDGFDYTRLTYDPPVDALQFPLEQGKEWATESTVSGTFRGVTSAFTEEYQYEVDARGELKTPFGTFPVLRVQVTLERTVGLSVTTVQQFQFVTECFGTVATIVSEDNESEKEFTEASEVRRLAP